MPVGLYALHVQVERAVRRIESFEDLLNDSSILAGLQDGGSTMSFFRVRTHCARLLVASPGLAPLT